MEIDIELYKIFYNVAKCGSITKAANVLYISQPAVTMSIKKLEEALDVTLFIRTKRGVILTFEGKVLYQYVENAMESIKIGENRLSSLKKLEHGSIRIGIGTTLTKFFLIKYLEEFHKKYPNISINIDTSMSSELVKMLYDGKVDMIVIVSDEINYKNVNVEYSQDIQYIFVGNKEYSKLNKINFSQLNEYPLLLQSANSSSRKFLDKVATRNNVILNASMELASYSLVIEFAKIGMGIGFVAKDYIKNELKKKELYEIKIEPNIPCEKILVLTKKDYLPTFSTKKLIEIIKGNN